MYKSTSVLAVLMFGSEALINLLRSITQLAVYAILIGLYLRDNVWAFLGLRSMKRLLTVQVRVLSG